MAWHNIREAAGLLSLSEDATYQLCKAREIEHRRVGPRRGKIQVSDEAIEAYLGSCVVPVGDASRAAPAPARVRKSPNRPAPARPDGLPIQFMTDADARGGRRR